MKLFIDYRNKSTKEVKENLPTDLSEVTGFIISALNQVPDIQKIVNDDSKKIIITSGKDLLDFNNSIIGKWGKCE